LLSSPLAAGVTGLFSGLEFDDEDEDVGTTLLVPLLELLELGKGISGAVGDPMAGGTA